MKEEDAKAFAARNQKMRIIGQGKPVLPDVMWINNMLIYDIYKSVFYFLTFVVWLKYCMTLVIRTEAQLTADVS